MIKPEKKHLTTDLTAGLTFALVNIPQAMGHALLAISAVSIGFWIALTPPVLMASA